MTTTMRSELSHKNQYHISKHRFYELKHFCQQYYEWHTELRSICTTPAHIYQEGRTGYETGNQTEKIAIRKIQIQDKIESIKKAASKTDPVIGDYILEAVIDGISYETMNARREIPCCKAIYYDLYRKFFYILSELRS